MRILELVLTDYPVEPSNGKLVFRVTQVVHPTILEHAKDDTLRDIIREMQAKLDTDISSNRHSEAVEL